MKRIFLIAGARPNFMKVAPIMRELAKHKDKFEAKLIHTGQHYDNGMSEVFFQELGIPEPDYNLGVGSGTHAQQTTRITLHAREKPIYGVAELNLTCHGLSRYSRQALSGNISQTRPRQL